jgi:hypothetical protein
MSGALGFILNLPRRPLFAFFIIFSIVMAYSPIAFPTIAHQDVIDFYNYVESIPAGSVVVIDWSQNILSKTQILLAPAFLYLVHLHAVPDIKILVFSTSTPGPVNWELMYQRIMPGARKALKPYGESIVYLGYIPGEESAIAALCSDIRGVKTADYYGTPLDTLPMMTTGHPDTGGPINDATAFHSVNFATWNANFIASFARVFGDAHQVPVVIPGIESWEVHGPYVPMYVKQYFMFPWKVEYEVMIGFLGITGIQYSTQAWMSLIMCALWIIMNIAYFMQSSQVSTEAVVRE